MFVHLHYFPNVVFPAKAEMTTSGDGLFGFECGLVVT